MNSKFLCYSLIALLPFVAIVVYISNLSLIFINHLGVSMEAFGYYQGSTMGAFLFFSVVGAKMIKAKGVDYTKNIGSVGVIIGGVALFVSALLNPTSILLICSSMFVFAAGGSLITGIFGMKALEIFPDIKGTASGAMTAIRQFTGAGLVLVSEIFFNGTIVPVALIIFAYVAVVVIWYGLVKEKPVYANEAEQLS